MVSLRWRRLRPGLAVLALGGASEPSGSLLPVSKRVFRQRWATGVWMWRQVKNFRNALTKLGSCLPLACVSLLFKSHLRSSETPAVDLFSHDEPATLADLKPGSEECASHP